MSARGVDWHGRERYLFFFFQLFHYSNCQLSICDQDRLAGRSVVEILLLTPDRDTRISAGKQGSLIRRLGSAEDAAPEDDNRHLDFASSVVL